MRFTATQMDELFGHPKPTLEDRRYDLRRDYETWFSDKNMVPDCDSWLVENLIERQKDYFKALASCEDEKKEMPTSALPFPSYCFFFLFFFFTAFFKEYSNR
jgi:hypothetical protein